MAAQNAGSGAEAIEVKVLPLGRASQTVALVKGAKISDALEAAGIEADGVEVRVSGIVYALDAILDDGDVLVITSTGQVKGGIE